MNANACVMLQFFQPSSLVKQAVCSRHALRIGSTVVPLVRVIIFVLFLITKPLSMLLDM